MVALLCLTNRLSAYEAQSVNLYIKITKNNKNRKLLGLTGLWKYPSSVVRMINRWAVLTWLSWTLLVRLSWCLWGRTTSYCSTWDNIPEPCDTKAANHKGRCISGHQNITEVEFISIIPCKKGYLYILLTQYNQNGVLQRFIAIDFNGIGLKLLKTPWTWFTKYSQKRLTHFERSKKK